MKLRRAQHRPLLEALEPRLLLSALALQHIAAARPVQAAPAHAFQPLIPQRQPKVVRATPAALLPPAATLGPSDAMTAPAAFLFQATAAEIFLLATAPSGGTGQYSYQWHRGLSAGFVPSAASAVAGATGLSLTDTGLSPGVPYFYMLAANDGEVTRYSNQVIAALDAPTLFIGLPYQPGPVLLASIGSSTWAINQGSGQVPAMIDANLRAVLPGFAITSFNGAVPGTQTVHYLPGQSLNDNVKAAVSGFSGYKVLRLMIGSNDAAAGRPVSAWLANMQAIIQEALAWPVDAVILEEIGVRLDGGNGTLELIRQYNAARHALAGPKVFVGTAHTFENQAIHLGQLSPDKVHQTDAGQLALAAHQAAEVRSLFTAPAALELEDDGAAYRLSADVPQGVLRLTRGNTASAIYQYPLSSLPPLDIHLAGSRQSLIMDYSGGPLPNAAVTSLRGNESQLSIVGASAGQSFSMDDYQLAGSGGVITFKNISALHLMRGQYSFTGRLITLDHLEVGEDAVFYWQ